MLNHIKHSTLRQLSIRKYSTQVYKNMGVIKWLTFRNTLKRRDKVSSSLLTATFKRQLWPQHWLVSLWGPRCPGHPRARSSLSAGWTRRSLLAWMIIHSSRHVTYWLVTKCLVISCAHWASFLVPLLRPRAIHDMSLSNPVGFSLLPLSRAIPKTQGEDITFKCNVVWKLTFPKNSRYDNPVNANIVISLFHWMSAPFPWSSLSSVLLCRHLTKVCGIFLKNQGMFCQLACFKIEHLFEYFMTVCYHSSFPATASLSFPHEIFSSPWF